jgi:hypothetical protein
MYLPTIKVFFLSDLGTGKSNGFYIEAKDLASNLGSACQFRIFYGNGYDD